MSEETFHASTLDPYPVFGKALRLTAFHPEYVRMTANERDLTGTID